MSRYSGVNHLAMATSDIEKTIFFWRDLLEMRLVAGLAEPGFKIYFFEISETDLIGFFHWPGVEPLPEKDHGLPVGGPYAFDHVAIGLKSRDDLWLLRDRLDAAGFWVSEVMDLGFIESLYSFDPNGIAIEFSWPKAEPDIRRQPTLVGDSPPAAALEGPAPRPERWPRPAEPTPPDQRRTYPGEGRALADQTKNRWRGRRP